MRELIRRLGGGARTIVLSSHDMDEVEQLCDRVGVIGGGRLLAEDTPDQLRGSAELRVQAKPTDVAATVAAGWPGWIMSDCPMTPWRWPWPI